MMGPSWVLPISENDLLLILSPPKNLGNFTLLFVFHPAANVFIGSIKLPKNLSSTQLMMAA